MLVFFTPVTFGGYSPELKRVVDRFIQLTLPFMEEHHGETHHPPRYPRASRFLVVGVQHHPDPEAARIFGTLAGRNALNFRPSGYSVEVVSSADDPSSLSARFESVISRDDELPLGEAVASLLPPADLADFAARPAAARRALLIVGSPKNRRPSTSGVLGGHLLERLREREWEIETLKLRASLCREQGQAEFMAAVNRAGLIVLAFPLYVDALPFLVTKALAVIADQRRMTPKAPPQWMVAICNSGFPEPHQNYTALAICRQFARECGISWAGGLAMGAGEALSSGQPLNAKHRAGPPIKHVIQALDIAGEALGDGRPVPAEATTLIARNPIPLATFAMWRWMFTKIGSRSFIHQAAANGVSREQLRARPYAS